MYRINSILPQNREPWLISLDERKRIIVSALREGKRIAAMLYHHADTSTFRYRCYNVFQATLESDCWQCIYFYYDEIEEFTPLLNNCSLLILARIKWTHAVEQITIAARKNNIPVLFDIDDLVFDINYLKLVTNTLNVHFGGEVDYDFWFAYISRLQKTASLADGYITTNDFLGHKLKELFNKPFKVIPNALNNEQLQVSTKCSREKLKARSKDPFIIGYFSGTPSHINDFRVISDEILQLLNDNSDIVLQVVGFMDFPDNMHSLIEKRQVRFSPLVDFLELQKLIAQVDINIVPLVNNTFTNCKSELKFFEAAVVNTVTIASPTYTYSHSIKDGETGFLCNPGQWYDRILYLYNNPQLANEMAKSANKYCQERYSGDNFLKQIHDAYDYFSQPAN